jgi:hypothetical protein
MARSRAGFFRIGSANFPSLPLAGRATAIRLPIGAQGGVMKRRNQPRAAAAMARPIKIRKYKIG